MPTPPPTIYLIAGSNGAGKTIFAREFLPHEVHCLRFLNADEIARGLSPLDPKAAALKAGRLLLDEISQSLRKRETFALESTLSGRTYIRLLARCREAGYEIELHFLWLSSPHEAIARVRQRVAKGGHHIRSRTSGGASEEHFVTSLRIISRWRHVGSFGTTEASAQNPSRIPQPMLLKQ